MTPLIGEWLPSVSNCRKEFSRDRLNFVAVQENRFNIPCTANHFTPSGSFPLPGNSFSVSISLNSVFSAKINNKRIKPPFKVSVRAFRSPIWKENTLTSTKVPINTSFTMLQTVRSKKDVIKVRTATSNYLLIFRRIFFEDYFIV